MELKNNVSNYTRANFLNFFQLICNAEASGEDHVKKSINLVPSSPYFV